MDIQRYSEVNVVTLTYEDMDFVKLTNKEMAKVENINISYSYYLSYFIVYSQCHLYLIQGKLKTKYYWQTAKFLSLFF